MRKIHYLGVLLLSVSLFSQAAIYECIDGAGRRIYSENKGKNCKSSNLGKPSLYTSAPMSTKAADTTNQTESPKVTAESAVGEKEQNELLQAQRNLKEGREVRYGNERNYVRYQERIAKLEEAVKQAEQKLKETQQ